MSKYTRQAANRQRLMNPPPLTGPVPEEIRPKQELAKGTRRKPPFQRLYLTSDHACFGCQRLILKGEVAVVSKRGGDRYRCVTCQPSVWSL
jgi:hypothetical protein